VHGQLGRHPAAERVAEHDRALEAEAVQEVEVVVDEVVHALHVLQHVGGAEAGVVGCPDLEALAQVLVQGEPAAAARGMEEQQRRSLAAAMQLDLAAADWEHLGIGHPRSPSRSPCAHACAGGIGNLTSVWVTPAGA
jgi:hypothetical protein